MSNDRLKRAKNSISNFSQIDHLKLNGQHLVHGHIRAVQGRVHDLDLVPAVVLVHLLVAHGQVHGHRHDQDLDLEVDPIRLLAVEVAARLGLEVHRSEIMS